MMAILMVGVLPLFTKSMINNVEGNQLSQVTTHARMRMESLQTAPLEGPDLTIPPGETELAVTELWSNKTDRWYEEADFPAGGVPGYARLTRVRQFNVSAIDDADQELTPDEALPGGTSPSLVHLKEIEVRVNTGPPSLANMMGRGKAVTLRVLRAY
jgi:hypothetical protein